jgi:hypothetical protein
VPVPHETKLRPSRPGREAAKTATVASPESDKVTRTSSSGVNAYQTVLEENEQENGSFGSRDAPPVFTESVNGSLPTSTASAKSSFAGGTTTSVVAFPHALDADAFASSPE